MPPHVHHFPGVQILLPGLSPFTDAAIYPNSGVQDRIIISVVFDLIMTWRYASPQPAKQLELPLGINYAPAIVRAHGLKDTHVQPLVSRRKGSSFRVMRGTPGSSRALSFERGTVGL